MIAGHDQDLMGSWHASGIEIVIVPFPNSVPDSLTLSIRPSPKRIINDAELSSEPCDANSRTSCIILSTASSLPPSCSSTVSADAGLKCIAPLLHKISYLAAKPLCQLRGMAGSQYVPTPVLPHEPSRK